ncbi:MAG: hypothetical protein HUJ61_07910 [Bacilli bacterium]|nr:hypothetical protein [Bacilli bacterium]
MTFDGEEYIVTRDKSYGYCDKNWGKDFTTPWLWLSSHNIEDEAGNKLNNTVFDIGGGKPKAFGISIPKKLLGAYYIEGKEFEFNFSKFWHPSKTKFTFDESDKDVVSWHVEQSDRHNLFITDVTCLKKDMLFVNYESPLGEKKHNKLWNGGNGTGIMKQYRKVKKGWQLVRTLTIKNIGCEYGEFDK